MKKNTERVVLNLQHSEAQELNRLLTDPSYSNEEIRVKISNQLNKTVVKNQIIRDNPDFTEEQINRALIAAGVKKEKPLPSKVMESISKAVNEIQEGEECPACGGRMLPEPDGKLACESCGAEK